jgi:hypothetical protein
MQTFRRRAGLVPAVLATAVIAAGLAASPAFTGLAHATTKTLTWTVTPGGNFTGKSGPVLLEDTTTGSTVKCSISTQAGTLKSGSGLSGTGIGLLTSVTYAQCAGPDGLAFTISASASPDNPWLLNAESYNAAKGVTTGTVTNIVATLSGAGCRATVAGPPATGPGTVKITYANGTHSLRFLTTGGNLEFQDVSGCDNLFNSGGLFNDGDTATMAACYVIAPPQTITGTPPDPRGDTTGTGPPC